MLDRNEIRKIVNCDHHDPRSILGMSRIDSNSFIARVFHPDAMNVFIRSRSNRKRKYRLEKIDPAGLFQARIDSAPFEYETLIDTWRGHTIVRIEPYDFPSTLGELDLHLFNEGNHFNLYEKLGARPMRINGVDGVNFALWAPGARRVSVIGPFCQWDGRYFPMSALGSSGVWEIFIPGLEKYELYKFEIKTRSGAIIQKSDPFGYSMELRPKSASVVWDQRDYEWSDQDWLDRRARQNPLTAPLSVYELHLGSWARSPDGSAWLSYREAAPKIADYVKYIGYTHIELTPIMEFPYDGSWGYQTIGYFAPTARFGSPDDFKYFVDFMHHHGIGVILDWTPAHFPKDDHGLRQFVGEPVYESSDPSRAEHADWGTLIFDYGRAEVANFLISSALFWLDQYHVDGLRVDAVASMLYLDYSRAPGEWTPNRYGGNENLDAIDFLRKLNVELHRKFPGALSIAEESTSFAGVSRPVHLGGLGFTMKWNMGWMNDTLEYFSKDPIYRKYHHRNLTFSALYAYSENFMSPLSHDEVVHQKGSLISKMPGDEWRAFANLRLLFCYMFAFPGKKLIFMGSDFGQADEWNYDKSLDWSLLKTPYRARLQRLMRDLAHLYRSRAPFFELDHDPRGFEWIDCDDYERSTISFIRRASDRADHVVCLFNMTPEPRRDFRVGVDEELLYAEILNSDASVYHGSNVGASGGVHARAIPANGRAYSIALDLPPLGALFLEPKR